MGNKYDSFCTFQNASIQRQRKLWQISEAPPQVKETRTSLIVTEVLTGDQLKLLDPETGEEEKVILACVSAPRIPTAYDKFLKPNTFYGPEAKEFVRERCIRAVVNVAVEYTKEIRTNPGNETKFVSLYYKRNNKVICLNEEMIANGFARLVMNGMGYNSDEKPRHFGKLL